MSRYPLSNVVVAAISVVAVSISTAAYCLPIEDLYIVSVPNAEVLPHGAYRFGGSLGPGSSILVSVSVGFFDRISAGVSFGFQEVIGRGDISVNDRVGLSFRMRFLDETTNRPAVTFGIETQGEGKYIEEDERYERKSSGVFLAIGKKYDFLGNISTSAGINYSLEDRDEGSLDLFAGTEIGLAGWFRILADYDASFDDDNKELESSRTRGRGYLDLGIRLDYRENLSFKILFKDMLDNYRPQSGVHRSIEVVYLGNF